MGEVFAGRYELVDLIGEGGMGTIWRAWDLRQDRMVAAKVLRQSDAATLLRFVREQSVRIHHPHVVVPLGWAGEDDRVLFTMPIVRGGSVATLVKDFGPLPPLLVAELLRQLLDGLGAVHAAGIVHRDVKPANLLLDPTGTDRPHLWLTDFGISVDLNAPRWTETGVISGTPGYLAPEMERFGTVTPAVDLYAAGQVGLTMLLGARPRDRAEVPHRPPGCPESLWTALGGLVAPDPAHRPADAAQAYALLDRPDLAWEPSGIGDVEVFEHLPADHAADSVGAPGPVPDDGTTRPRATTAVAPAPVDPTAGSPRAQPPTGSRAASAVPAALVALAAVGGLLIWSPWTGRGEPVIVPTTGATASGPTTPVRPSSSVPSAGTSPSETPSTGSVRVGTVVVRVGQECSFSEVGSREDTVGGDPVVCTRRSDGTYAWLAAPR